MRKINELVWHCTATREGEDVSVATIDRWHKKRGWSGIGYHKVIHLDGSVEEGRDINKIPASVRGHNTGTIAYVYVGGVKKDGRTPKDTRTPAQKLTMALLTKKAIDMYGITKVSGHNEYDNKACPSFNVQTDPTIQKAIGGFRKKGGRSIITTKIKPRAAGGVAKIIPFLFAATVAAGAAALVFLKGD